MSRSPRIAHVTDLHLGGDDFATESAVVEGMTALIDEAEPDLLALTGDMIYGIRTRATPRVRNTLADFLRHSGERRPTVVIRGNHDLLGDFLHFNDIAGVTYVEADTPILPFELAGVPVRLYCFPYPDSKWLGTPDDVEPGRRIAALQEAMRERVFAWTDARFDAPEGVQHLVLYHGDVQGTLLDINQPLISAEPRFEPDDFADFDGVLAGHIHYPHTLRASTGAPIVYPGAQWPTKHGEKAQHERGPVVWDLGPQGWTQRRLNLVSLPAYRKRLTFELVWSERDSRLNWLDTGEPWAGLPREGVNAATTADVYLRNARINVVVRYPSTARKAIDFDALARVFRRASGTADVNVQAMPSGDSRVPEGTFAQARTLEDELRAMWKVLGGAPTNEADVAWFADAMAQLQET